MYTTRARRKLINDAIGDGCRVTESNGCCRIQTGKTQRSIGIVLWPDGTATRSDVDHSLRTSIRTVKAMRQILGLKQ